MGSISIDVPSYMKLKSANIVSVEQVRALISLMSVITDIRVMKVDEFSKLVQVIISGENDSEMTFDSRQMDSMRILGVDGLTGIRNMTVYSLMNLEKRLAELSSRKLDDDESELATLGKIKEHCFENSGKHQHVFLGGGERESILKEVKIKSSSTYLTNSQCISKCFVVFT